MVIKVNRQRLIQALDAKRKYIVDQAKKAEKEYQPAFFEWRKAAMKRLDKVRREIAEAYTIGEATRSLEYRNRLNLPEAPDKPAKAKTAEYDSALAQLALVDDEVITLNEKKDKTFLDLLG